MTGLKYLVAEYIWYNKCGVTYKQLLDYLETIENVTYEKGAENTLQIILEDLQIEGLINIHNGTIFLKF